METANEMVFCHHTGFNPFLHTKQITKIAKNSQFSFVKIETM